MLENRKILTATIGYIIGIILGLYCKISIVFFYIIMLVIYLIISRKRKKKFKLVSFARYFRYLKIIFNNRVIIIIIIFSFISNSIVLVQNEKYKNLYQNLDNQNIKLSGVILSISSDKYKIKINNGRYKNTYLYMHLKNTLKNKLNVGDNIVLEGIYEKPQSARNYKGFDYENYLKSLKIFGIIKANKIEIISRGNINIFLKITNKLSKLINDKINNSFMSDEEKSLLKGIILGNKDDISENIENSFSASNISYLLAVSGIHIFYIIFVSKLIFEKLVGKHYSKIFISIVIVMYMGITDFTPSVVRAGLTGIIIIMSDFFYSKNDVFQSLALVLLIMLAYNPFLIQNLGLQLSFVGTIGILMFVPTIRKIVENFIIRKEKNVNRTNKQYMKKILIVMKNVFFQKILDSVIVTFSASLAIMPIILVSFNKVNVTNIIIGIISSFVIGPIIILGLMYILIDINIIGLMLSFFINCLLYLAQIGENLLFGQIYFITPNWYEISTYYLVIFVINYMVRINISSELTMTQIRIKNLIQLFKYRYRKKKKKIISMIILVCIIVEILIITPKNLKIYFVDVGQGDCTLVVTPMNRTFLIDGGGKESNLSSYNVR